MNNYKVYIHISPSNKMYVGQTKQDILKRWSSGYKNNFHFNNAIKKYGWDNFIHTVIRENLTKHEADLLEKLFISELRTQNPLYGYNIQNGGAKDCMSAKVKNKIGKGNSKTVYQYFINGELKQIHPSCHEAAKSIKKSYTGISQASRGLNKFHLAYGHIWLYEKEHKSIQEIVKKYQEKIKEKSIEQYNLLGELINTFGSLDEASEICRLNKTSIYQCISKKNNTYAGYIWRYKNNNKDIMQIVDKINTTNSYPKVINMYDLNHVFIRQYKSIAEAHLDLKISIQNISKCAKGERKTAGGYIWEFVVNDHK